MSRHVPSTGSQTGFAVAQTLIVSAIAAIVVAIAVPVYAARAKETVLRQNATTLELEVKSYLAAGLDATDDKRSASEVIAQALGGHGGGISTYYVNPLCGSHAVVCQTAPPSAAGGTPPAVWITDDQHYTHAAFSPSATTRSQLAGTLLVVFTTTGGRTSAIDIYYVDAAGLRSAAVATLGV